MGRWTPDDHGCIYDETGCFARLTPNKAERLATRHNADIDEATADRDELKRRLDAVVKEAENSAMKNCTCFKYKGKTVRCYEHDLHDAIIAIAEGPEG